MTIVILVREIGVTLLRFWVIRRGVHRRKSRRQGQDRAAGRRDRAVSAAAHRVLASARAYLMAVAVIITLVTGADYVARAVRLRRATSARAVRRAGDDLPAPVRLPARISSARKATRP